MTQQASEGVTIGQPVAAATYASMFQCVSGLRNWRAAGAMMGCFVAGILLAGLVGMALGQPGFGKSAIAALLLLLFYLTGIHAAGVLLMDQARGVAMRSVTDALVYGLLCVPKTIGLIIGLVLAAVGVYIVLALLILLCKLPGLGPVLYTIVFPLVVVIGGLTATALMLCFQMALSAIWEGASITRALAQSVAILRSRLVETVLLLAVVLFLAGVVFVFVASVLMFGLMPATGMSASILGGQGAVDMGGVGDGMGGAMAGLMSGGGAGGYAIAGAIGGGVLWAIAMTLVFQVALLGVNLVYLRVSEGLDASATEAAMLARIDDAKRKASEMGQKAKEVAERARAQAQQATTQRRAVQAPPVVAAAPPQAAASSACPQCSTAIAPEDLFCDHCGFKLKQSGFDSAAKAE